LIGELSRDGTVIPLAYHVDYWNYLGWTDPFSSKSWTERQMMYVRAFHQPSAYTPEAVINGSTHVAGSDARAVRATILQESRRPPEATIALRTAPGGRVHVTASSKNPHLDAVLAIVEDAIVTPVRRGENAGRTLRNDFIVRKVQRVGSLPVDTDVPLNLDPAWKHVRVVAFAQDRETLRIHGAGVVQVR
jgi:hypothetical protein